LAQVGPKLGVQFVHVNVDDLKAGKQREWLPFMKGGSIPYTVLLDPQKKPVNQWVGGYSASEFTKILTPLIKK